MFWFGVVVGLVLGGFIGGVIERAAAEREDAARDRSRPAALEDQAVDHDAPDEPIEPADAGGTTEEPDEVAVDDGDPTRFVYRLAELHSQEYQASAKPTDVESQAGFLKAADFIRSGPFADEQLLDWAIGDNGFIACAALRAFGERDVPDDADERERLARRHLDVVRTVFPWGFHFAVRAVRERAAEDESWLSRVFAVVSDTALAPMATPALDRFARERLDCGDRFDFTGIELDDEQLERLGQLAERFGPRESAALRTALETWACDRVDVDFLRQIGRVWDKRACASATDVVATNDLQANVTELVGKLTASPGRSVLLVGEPGTGKSVLARRVAAELANDGWLVFEAGEQELVAGTKWHGEFEERLEGVLRNIRGSRKVLWYVPDFAGLAYAGRTSVTPSNALDVVLEPIERGEITVLGQLVPRGLDQVLREKPGVRGAFEVARLEPASREHSLALARSWATRRGITCADDVLEEAWHLAGQFLNDRTAPGHLLGLLEHAARRVVEAGAEAEARVELASADLLATLAALTGLPETVLDERQGLELEALRRKFVERVHGQPDAVECLVDRVAMIKAGVTDPTRPLGVFLFAGPTGTGKTELCKVLAEFLFGSTERMIRVDMSELGNPEDVTRLVGASWEHGPRALVDQIREQPFSVVLLDEFEKAHPAVWDLFLQVFDDGRLTDRRGRTADFRHAILIMTSNLGAVVPSGRSLGFASGEQAFDRDDVMKTIERTFRREFVNRIDRVVVFQPLSRETMRAILENELRHAFGRRGLRNRAWAVEWDDAAIEFLLTKGFTTDLGARPLKRALEHHLLAPLAHTIVEHRAPAGDQFLFVRVDADGRRLRVDFVDPDAATDTPAAAGDDRADEAVPEVGGRAVLSIALDPHGRPDELTALMERRRELRRVVDGDAWAEARDAAMRRTHDVDFWNSDDRHAVLGEIEYRDRIARGLDGVQRLVDRLRGQHGARNAVPRDFVAELAARVLLLERACETVDSAPPDAFLSVEPGRTATAEPAELGEFARRLAAMYRAWASARQMSVRVLVDRDAIDAVRGEPSFVLAVSGFAAFPTLLDEDGQHVWEEPTDREGSFRRFTARVSVRPWVGGQVGLDGKRKHLLAVARAAFETGDRAGDEERVVRRYREQPSPLVRDGVRGWRTGRLDRVLAGDFDLFAAE